MSAVLLFGVLMGLGVQLLAADAWQEFPTHKIKPVQVPKQGKAGFSAMDPGATGIHFTNLLRQERHLTNSMLLNGSGVAAGDVDGDGWCDIYLCGLDNENKLFKNLGNWRFTDITAEAGVHCPGIDSTGAALVDLDADGDLDLIVNTFTVGTLVFRNNGQGRFAPWIRSNLERAGMSLGIGDLNADGWLDIYVANYRQQALIDMPFLRFTFKMENGRRVLDTIGGKPASHPALMHRFVINPRGGVDEHGEPDLILYNQGGTNLVPGSFTAGNFLEADGSSLQLPPFDWGLSVAVRDLNQDGSPDIYVCNDFDSADRIWINQGAGRFKIIDPVAVRKTSFFSMGVDFSDINRDGWDDFLVLDMATHNHLRAMTTALPRYLPIISIGDITTRAEYMINTLLLNRGDGTYAEIGQYSGVWGTEWSWAAAFLDVDLDGYEDLLVSNGYERDARNLDVQNAIHTARAGRQMSFLEQMQFRKMFPKLETPNVAYRNRGDYRFQDVSQEWGFDLPAVSNGMCLADLDNDGDLEVIVNNMNSGVAVYRNNATAPRIAVALEGAVPNRSGIGARITVRGGPVVQSQEMMAGGKYLSSDQPLRSFAAGTQPMEIEVLWPDLSRTRVEKIPPNSLCIVKQSGASSQPEKKEVRVEPWFTDMSPLLNHHHVEQPFDDFARQPLLTRKFSQEGPGMAFGDLDADGQEELIVTSGRGGNLEVFENLGEKFVRSRTSFRSSAAHRDQLAVLTWTEKARAKLLITVANYEDGVSGGVGIETADVKSGAAQLLFPAQGYSFGPMTMGDVDGDGSLELFVGGKVVPGQYPSAASSLLLRQNDGQWQIDATNTELFKNLGMVSSAVMADMDGDGYVDLLVATHAGPIHFFQNQKGKLRQATENFGLSEFVGLWNSVAVGDFDGDGKLDFVGGNWGMNQAHTPDSRNPLVLHHGDFNEDGIYDVVESYFDQETRERVPVRGLELLSRGLPILKEQFTTYAAFGRANMEKILGAALQKASEIQLRTGESTVFLNRDSHFMAIPLPAEAQFSPAFGVGVADFDGDGKQDLFLAQNFSAVSPEVPRWDAGVGLVLRGLGEGKFQALTTPQSGIRMHGDGRGVALADWNGDGRMDLAVGQNGGETKLYQNGIGSPGIRVQLKGPQENPEGVGAIIRTADGAQAITKGSGWLGCDSPIRIVRASAVEEGLEVIWPGGKKQEIKIGPGTKQLEVIYRQ